MAVETQGGVRERFLFVELRPLTAGTGKTPWLDLSAYPSGSIQCIPGAGGDAPTGLVLAWEGALVDDDNAAVVLVSGVTETDLATKDKGILVVPTGIRYVRGNVSQLTGGRVRIVGLKQTQAG